MEHKILEMEIPNFPELRPDIEPKLNEILHMALKRPREERYQSSEEMLTELESFIYGKGYGPTNEKLAAYVHDLFGDDGQNAALRWHRGETPTIMVAFICLDNFAYSEGSTSSMRLTSISVSLTSESQVTMRTRLDVAFIIVIWPVRTSRMFGSRIRT